MQVARHLAATRRREAMLAQSASEVSFGRTVIEVIPRDSGYTFKVDHELESRGFQSKQPLVVDLSSCPFLLYDISCSVSLRPSQEGEVVFFHLAPEATWQGAHLKYELRWNTAHPKDPVDRTAFLRFPSMLPSPIGVSWSRDADTSFRQQVIQFVPDELAGNLIVVGLPARLGGKGKNVQECLELVIGRGTTGPESLRPSPLATVRVSEALTSFLGNGKTAQLLLACATSLDFLQGHLGEVNDLGVTVCLGDDLAPDVKHAGGTLLSFQRTDFDRYPVGSFGFDVELTRELASMWWGCGCHLLGKHSKELESAIGGAFGLLYGRGNGGDGFAKTIAAYENLAQGSVLKDRWLGAIGRGQPRLTGEFALALYRGLLTNQGEQALKSLTADFWGLNVPVVVLHRELSHAGIELPDLP